MKGNNTDKRPNHKNKHQRKIKSESILSSYWKSDNLAGYLL